MQRLTLDTFNGIVTRTDMKPRLKKDLRFVASTAHISNWDDFDMVSIRDKTGNSGVLLVSTPPLLYLQPYEISSGLTDQRTGRSQAIICDFCRTWQPGSNSARITFRKDRRSMDSVSFLCCGDLLCSLHARLQTKASITSRAQVREDISPAKRIARLQIRLSQLTADLGMQEVTVSG